MARITPRAWAAIFFVSLALNALLAGILVTAYVKRGSDDRDLVYRMTVYTVPWAYRVIGEEIGPAARSLYVENQSALARDRQVLAQDYKKINRILSAQTFDSEAFSQALAKLRADIAAAQLTMHDTMGRFAAQLSREQRQQLVNFVEEWSQTREQRAIRRDKKIGQRSQP